jgi:hypothetical protein
MIAEVYVPKLASSNGILKRKQAMQHKTLCDFNNLRELQSNLSQTLL